MARHPACRDGTGGPHWLAIIAGNNTHDSENRWQGGWHDQFRPAAKSCARRGARGSCGGAGPRPGRAAGQGTGATRDHRGAAFRDRPAGQIRCPRAGCSAWPSGVDEQDHVRVPWPRSWSASPNTRDGAERQRRKRPSFEARAKARERLRMTLRFVCKSAKKCLEGRRRRAGRHGDEAVQAAILRGPREGRGCLRMTLRFVARLWKSASQRLR
jgi:hypothetical protein